MTLGSVLDIMNCHGQGYDLGSNKSFEVVNLFLFTYYCFHLVITGPPGAGQLNKWCRGYQYCTTSFN